MYRCTAEIFVLDQLIGIWSYFDYHIDRVKSYYGVCLRVKVIHEYIYFFIVYVIDLDCSLAISLSFWRIQGSMARP